MAYWTTGLLYVRRYILILEILVYVRNRNVEQVKRPKRAVACLQTLLDPCIQLN